MKRKAIGIDLGTTYSCVACVSASGKPEVVPNGDGERTTPSVVWFDEDRVVVGEEAKGMAPLCPNDVASFVKREMGSDSYRFSCSQGDLRPEQVSACILKKLVKDAKAALGQDIKDVVITCPAYFSFKEREATKAAGEIAGLNVLSILNEPTAAAISYGLSSDTVKGVRHILVYDLGGGTFDVTMIKVAKSGISVICTDGNHQLGGKDWDDRLIDLLIDKFQRATGIMHDLFSDANAMRELAHLAERSKKALSNKTETSETFNYAGEKHRLTITREEFEAATQDLLMETVNFTRAVIDSARAKGVTTIDELILVGGSTRMPMVPDILTLEFGMTPKSYDPDEAVAKGAAIVAMAQILQEESGFTLEADGRSRDGKFILEAQQQEKLQKIADDNGLSLETVTKIMTPISNVCSKSFGQILCRHEDEVERIFNAIYRNTNLPAEVEFPCYTLRDNQTGVNIQIVENMEEWPSDPAAQMRLDREGIDPDEGTILWEGLLKIQSGLPKGAEIRTVFQLDKNGILHILSRDPASGNEIEATIETNCTISEKDMKKMRESLRDVDVD